MIIAILNNHKWNTSTETEYRLLQFFKQCNYSITTTIDQVIQGTISRFELREAELWTQIVGVHTHFMLGDG